MPVPGFRVCYRGGYDAVAFVGTHIDDRESFQNYLADSVRDRLQDVEQARSFVEDLRGLATTDMASTTLADMLSAHTGHEPWQIGEALAECLMRDIEGATWPWNAERDKRTPRASLPGADLVGFMRTGDQVFLLLGEVKTSSDPNAPPNVMNGRTGMIHQMDQLASEPRLHRTILSWLHVRCKNTEFWPLYQEALGSYLRSGGRQLTLYGVLVRDTAPAENDLQSRANNLATKVPAPTIVTLHAWYLPCSASEWPALVRGNQA